MISEYRVPKTDRPLSGMVVVPGSKSITNRALLLAALSTGKTILRGVLFSDDSRYFLEALRTLGFRLNVDEDEKKVEIEGTGGIIPNQYGTINVGSAGTAARFLTAFTALSHGEYIIECSEQMKKRPMEELFRVLKAMGAEFTYLEEDMHLPVKVKGNKGNCRDITMDISKSTQFLSAMLMVTPVTQGGINIEIAGNKKTGSYIEITLKMLKNFGVDINFDGNSYHIKGGQKINIGEYNIEPDVSAACYFYAMAALTGGEITVENVFYSSMQGDIMFLDVLGKMGCTVFETPKGICVRGCSKLKGVDVDMNNFSDQALTLAAIAPYAEGHTTIRHIGHIRGQECNRISAIINELTRCGIECYEQGDDVHINSGRVHGAEIETYDDHRVAMAFTIMGLMSDGIIIRNPMCCRKTFENYYEVLNRLIKDNEL